MNHTTLLFLLDNDKVLLAMKKRGFGKGRWNGAGGKVEPGESYEAAAIREAQEEIGITPHQPKKAALLTFKLPKIPELLITHTYIATSWDGEPIETEEMRPQWFAITDIPYDAMWSDDLHWLPHVLAGNLLKGEFTFDDNDIMLTKNISLDVTEGDLHEL